MIEPGAARESFRRAFGGEPVVCAWAPGRVNLIGEHIDYADGWVLPLALDCGVTVAAAPGEPGRLRVHSDQYIDAGVAEYDPTLKPPATFVAFVHALALATDVGGADLAVVSDLPIERGWSSSAAFGVAVASALLGLRGGPGLPAAIKLCRICQGAETRALGVACGLMDQYVAVFGERGSALWLDLHRMEHTHVPVVLGDAVLVLADSGQPRRLAESGYNERRRELGVACEELKRRIGDFKSLREVNHGRVLGELAQLSPVSQRRLRHVITEHARVKQFVERLREGDLIQLGQLLSASQHSLSDDYEVSTPELDTLCDLLTATPGIYGARLVGGGFGGGALALADVDSLAQDLPATLRRYEELCGISAAWDQLVPGEGAMVLLPGAEPELVREWLP